MGWGRIDDTFDDHPKVLALLDAEEGAAAIGLWTLCFTWAHRNTRKKGKTPGLLPASLPRRYLGPVARDLAALLVKEGLWEPVDGGWQIHDFDQYLPTTKASEARSEAGRKGAEARWGSRPDGKEPSVDGNQPSGDGKPMANGMANDGSRARARRVREGVSVRSKGSDRTSVDAARDQSRGCQTITQRSKTLTDAYAAAEPMCKWPAVNGVVILAIKSGKFTDDEIHAGLLRLAAEGRSVTVDALRAELQGWAPRMNGNSHHTGLSPASERVGEAERLAAKYAGQ